MKRLTIRPRITPESRLGFTQDDVLALGVQEARAIWADFRAASGLAHSAPPILSAPKGNAKLAKTMAYGLSLSPARSAGHVNVCPSSTTECRRFCVSKAGRGGMAYVATGRKIRTDFMMAEPLAFLRLLVHEIGTAHRKHDDLHVRLNTFSDIAWERVIPWMFAMFPDVQFYDYTKRWDRIEHTPANYALAASVSEATPMQTVRLFDGPMAVVLDVPKGQPMPATWQGHVVVDADLSDRWIVEHAGCPVVGGLRPKGKLAKSNSPFIRSI